MEPDPVIGHPVPGMQIWGWMSPAELLWLGDRAAEMGSVAEIGCLHGRSAFMLLSRCPGPVYCIDPWDDEHDLCYGSFMSSCGEFPNLVAIRGYSPEAAALIEEDVDMTFIDGDHAVTSVEKDIAAWLPKTRRLICGHDYWQGEDAGFPGVAEAVDRAFGSRVSVAPDTGIWAVEL